MLSNKLIVLSLLRSWWFRVLLYAGLWWLLTQGVASAWVIGIFVVPLAAWLSLFLLTDRRSVDCVETASLSISLIGLLRFIPYFIFQSLRGGWDTAWRALHPQLPITPGFTEYSLQQLPSGPARVFFMNVVSLSPGSLTVEENNNDRLLIHVLNTRGFSEFELQRCEHYVAALFSLSKHSTDEQEK